MSAKTSQNNDGRFHCLKCGRKHNRSGDIGSFHHYGLDVAREGFQPQNAAVGIAFVRAYKEKGRRRPSATVEEIEKQFEKLGFREQFPHAGVEATVKSWKDQGLIGDERHSGKHWFIFLANRYTPRNASRSPESFHIWMKRFANEFGRANKR